MQKNVRAFLLGDDKGDSKIQLGLAELFNHLKEANKNKNKLKDDLSDGHSEVTLLTVSILDQLSVFTTQYSLAFASAFSAIFKDISVETSVNFDRSEDVDDIIPFTTRYITTKNIFQIKYNLRLFFLVDGNRVDGSFLALVGISDDGSYYLNSHEFMKLSERIHSTVTMLMDKMKAEVDTINFRLRQIPNSWLRFSERKILNKRDDLLRKELEKANKILASVSQFISLMIDQNSDFFVGNINAFEFTIEYGYAHRGKKYKVFSSENDEDEPDSSVPALKPRYEAGP